MLSGKIKTTWLYVITAVFVVISMCLLIKKNTFVGFALPVVFGMLLALVYSMDKVLLFIAFVTPISVVINLTDSGLAVSMPAEPLLACLLLIFIIKLIYERKYDGKIARHPISIVIYLMFIWMVFTTITSEMPLVSIKYIISRMWFVIPAYFMCAKLFKKPQNINKFIWLYVAGLCIVVIYTIINHSMNGFSGKSAHWVMTPFYNDHTAYGAALAIYIVFCVAYLFMPNISKTRKVTISLISCLLLAALILSFCRASWISIIATICVLACVLLKIKFKYIATTVVVLVGLFLAFQQQIFDALERNDQDASGNLVENIQSITNISTDASNLERLNRWNSAFRLFEERPFFGWGPGTYQFVYAPFQESRNKTIITTNEGDGGNAHSEYIGPLAEMGVFGSLLVVSLVAVMIYSGLTTYKRAKNKESKVIVLASTLALIGYFVHGILNNFLDTDKLAVPVWSCMAIITAIDIYHADKEEYYSE